MSDLSNLFDNTPTGANHSDLAAAFDMTEAAARMDPLPTGEYVARAVSAALDESRKGTPFYGVRFEIVDGPHAGRRLVHRWFLSSAALPYSRRDLAALGLSTFAQLQSGAAPTGLVRIRVALRRDDAGAMFNEVRDVSPGVPAAPAQGHNEANAAAPQPMPVSVAHAPVSPEPQTPTTPATADDLPAGLVDAGLL